MSTTTTRTRKGTAPLRFAHPFYTPIPPPQRTLTPYGQRMTDHIQGTLNAIPPVKGTSVMTLADIIGQKGAAAIEKSGTPLFHATGDTGRSVDSAQGDVAAAMARDFNIAAPQHSPAFFLHLGDVIYGHTKGQSYRQEFYEPYMHYPGKIVAIPGNHDGETIPRTDPETLRAFKANFCTPSARVPAIAGSIFRETMTQPGVYWLLDAPFVDIIGLYSNSAENPGFISGKIPGPAQKRWLVNLLRKTAEKRKAGKRKALVLATQLHTLLQSIGNRLVERFLLFDGSTVVEGDLNEDAIGRASDAQVAGVDAEIFGWMLIDDLEAVILGHIQRRAHRVVDDFAHGAAIIGWLAPSEIDSN